jgi:hypothetical protein
LVRQFLWPFFVPDEMSDEDEEMDAAPAADEPNQAQPRPIITPDQVSCRNGLCEEKPISKNIFNN